MFPMFRELSYFNKFTPTSILHNHHPLLSGLKISYVKLVGRVQKLLFLFHFILAMSRRRVVGNWLMFEYVHPPNFHIFGGNSQLKDLS